MKPKYCGKPKRKRSKKQYLKDPIFVKSHLLNAPSVSSQKKHQWTKIDNLSSSENEYGESGSHLSTTTTSSIRQPNKYIALDQRERSPTNLWSNMSSSSSDEDSSDKSEEKQQYVRNEEQVALKTIIPTVGRSSDQEVENDSDSDALTELFSTKRNFWLFESERTDICILVLRHPCQVVLSGRLQIRTISGSAEVHGWELSPSAADDSQFVPVFSSKLCGSYMLTTIGPEQLPKRVPLIKHLAARLHTVGAEPLMSSILSVSTMECVLVALTRLDLPGPVLYATTKLSPSLFSPQPSPFACLRLGFSILPQMPDALCVTDHHRDIAKQICYSIRYAKSVGCPAPRIVVCGDRNTGKSSFIRYLINAILSSEVCSSMYHLEGDPGQSEFTPSSCVSLTRVDCPLLGPPLTHQKTPLRRCFVGGPNVEDTPDLFSQSITKLIAYYDENLTGEPLIVNTMGWTRGLGLSLLVDVLRLSRPKLVIQMDTQVATLPVLNRQFLVDECGWNSTRAQAETSDTDIEFRRVNSINPELSHSDIAQLGLAAPLHRSLSALTYIGRMVRGRTGGEKALSDIEPNCVPWCEVGVMLSSKITVKQENLLDVINGSWVTLCCVPPCQLSNFGNPAMPKFLNSLSNHCIGYGLVQAIDEVEETILILTPEPLRKLQDVNAIAITGDLLPAVIYTSQETEGPVPFVSQTSVQSKAGLGVRIKQTHKKFLFN